MYDVQTDKIQHLLSYMEGKLALLRHLTDLSIEDVASDPVRVAAFERALHLCIEVIADVGNALIDGFIMRDPGSYTDIVEILRDETVLDEGQAALLTEVVGFRKSLVNDYSRVSVEEMYPLTKKCLPALESFGPSVRAYLEKELF